MNISERAMLVTLKVTSWSAAKHDKRVSREVATQHASDIEMGRYNKQLLSKSALEKVKSAINTLRAEHYKRTLPWAEDGDRILSSVGYFDYTQAIRRLTDEVNNAAEEFIYDYPSYQREARTRLNGLYRDEDYPSVDVLRTKFSVAVNFSPFPTADDFRIDLGNVETSRIKQSIEESVKATLDNAMGDVYQRIYDVTSKMAERLRAYAVTDDGTVGTFRNSLVDNVRELVDVLPALNITGSSDVSKFTDLLKANLCNYDAETLRQSPTARETTAIAAEEIMKQMADFI